MKSKITIDVDYDNQPIIKIEYEDSPDVRDKLVKNFLTAFGGDSIWANFCYEGLDNKTAKLRPINVAEIGDQWESMKQKKEEFDEFAQKVTKND